MQQEKKSFLYNIANFIVSKRNLFFFLFTLACIFSVFSMGWTEVENDLTAYLDEETQTSIGLNLMEEEFLTFGSASVMLANIDYATAESVVKNIEEIAGVDSVDFDQTEEHYKNASALFSVNFDGVEDDPEIIAAMEEIRELVVNYDFAINTSVGVTDADTLAEEMQVIMVVAVIIILAVLLFTSNSYGEIPVFLITFAVAALINMGTNFIFGSISFVSNSVAVILQLALAIDYAIILCHRFAEECEFYDPKEACVVALSKAMVEISSSSLTTISGLFAMSFMSYLLGADLSFVLIKSIFLSLICVFTLMPGLLVVFSSLIEKTRHKNFVPSIAKLGEFSFKARKFILPTFFVLAIVAMFLSTKTEYLFSATEIRAANLNERQIQEDRIKAEFGSTNAVVVIVPSGDYDKEAELIGAIEGLADVESVVGLANTDAMDDYTLTDSLNAREFSELLDIDYEDAITIYIAYAVEDENYAKLINDTDNYELPLIDIILFVNDMVDDGYVTLDADLQDELGTQSAEIIDAQLQLESDTYSRLIVLVNLPEEGEETFVFLDTLNAVASTYYDEVYLVGNSVSNYDLSNAFSSDNLIISILSALFVVTVLLFTFGSVAIPLILIIIIQSAIFMNFAFPYLTDTGVFFIGYLVVSSIQMGANVDYAIVITNRYMTLRKTMDDRKAIVEALDKSFVTILTSGTMLASAGIVIQNLTSDGTIATIGECVGRGTLISMVLVIFVLPQILYFELL